MNIKFGLFTKPEGVPHLERDWFTHDGSDAESPIDAVEEAAQAGKIPMPWIILVQAGRVFVLAWDADRPLDGPIFDSRENDNERGTVITLTAGSGEPVKVRLVDDLPEGVGESVGHPGRYVVLATPGVVWPSLDQAAARAEAIAEGYATG